MVKKEQTALAVVSSPQTALEDSLRIEHSVAHVEALDTNALREDMVKGIYALEKALFEQAGFEYARVNKLRSLINRVEDDIFDEEKFKNLPPEVQIQIYRQASTNMRTSMDYLQRLHQNVASGVDTINQIEKLKAQRAVPESKNHTTAAMVDQVKTLIQNKIKDKINNK
jgi:hypothetical protein